jgi:hypothetical protein
MFAGKGTGPMAKTTKAVSPPVDTIESLGKQLEEKLAKFTDIRKSPCFPLLLTSARISHSLVDDVFDDLRSKFGACKSLDVIVDSGGGDIDAAFNIATLLRQYASDKLCFIVPRWAKSATTLLVCAGDEILMTPPAELGPLDPQITVMSPLERRIEQFSPLHIESTLELIREEFDKGSEKLANALMNRLQFPLTLGSFRKSLDISREYMAELLASRMLSGQKDKAMEIAVRCTKGYVDHSYCIKIAEAQRIGLIAKDLDKEQLDIVWDIHKCNKKREKLESDRRKQKMKDKLKDIPAELMDLLPPELLSAPNGTPALPEGEEGERQQAA